MTKFLLDSGDPQEYREIKDLAEKAGSSLWGATTNPTLIAKKLGGDKYTLEEAYALQKKIVLEILEIVPGAVSAEVYADTATTADEMIHQGKEIAKWHTRIVVKLPTTLEGLKARTELRRSHIAVNNTLVFSQEQIFAICLHEFLIEKLYGPIDSPWPPFISPFVGRLDDIGLDGMDIIEQGMRIKKLFELPLPKTVLPVWMLESSVRTAAHIRRGLTMSTEIMTAPAKTYREWFALSPNEQENLDATSYAEDLKPISYWNPPKDLMEIGDFDTYFEALESGRMPISHDLTDKGLERFAEDWKAILK